MEHDKAWGAVGGRQWARQGWTRQLRESTGLECEEEGKHRTAGDRCAWLLEPRKGRRGDSTQVGRGKLKVLPHFSRRGAGRETVRLGFSVAMTNNHNQKHLRGKSFSLQIYSSSSWKAKAGILQGQMKQTTWKNSVYWFASFCLCWVSFLTQPRTMVLDNTTHTGPGPPTSNSNQENALNRHARRPI